MHTHILEKAFSNNHLSNFSSRIWRILLCPRQIPGKKRNLLKVFFVLLRSLDNRQTSFPPLLHFPKIRRRLSRSVPSSTGRRDNRQIEYQGMFFSRKKYSAFKLLFAQLFFLKKWLTAESISGKKALRTPSLQMFFLGKCRTLRTGRDRLSGIVLRFRKGFFLACTHAFPHHPSFLRTCAKTSY